jgi:hypothetical protein
VRVIVARGSIVVADFFLASVESPTRAVAFRGVNTMLSNIERVIPGTYGPAQVARDPLPRRVRVALHLSR